jgi:hypothetical protein
MQSEVIPCLQKAIRSLHGCEAAYEGYVPVVTSPAEHGSWSGDVYILSITEGALGYRGPKRAYVWLEECEGQRKPVVVLESATVRSPHDAVRTMFT